MTQYPNRLAHTLALLLLALTASACTSVALRRPNIDYDPAASFAALRSFAWKETGVSVPSHDPRLENPLFEGRVRGAVEQGLGGRNLHPAPTPASADVLVAVHLLSEKRLYGHVSPPFYPSPYFFPRRFHYYGWSGPGLDMHWSERDSITLLLDLIDPRSGKLIWRGTAKDALDPEQTPEEQRTRLDAVTGFLLSGFPP